MTVSLTHIDLFAGCGGLSTGLHLAGWQGLFAVERNASAFSTLKANLIDRRKHFDWPSWLRTSNWDIEGILAKECHELAKLRGKVGLVAGAPPCAGFSMAGRRRESDQRNSLVNSYLSFVELVRPRAIIFENVRGFTMKFKANADSGITYSQLVIHRLNELGYTDARGEIIDMSYYGVPQRRRRFIVIATLENLSGDIFEELERQGPLMLAAKGIPNCNSARGALSDLEFQHGAMPCPETSGFLSGTGGRSTTGLQRYLRAQRGRRPPNSHRFVNHTAKVKRVFTRLLASAPRDCFISGAERKSYGLKKRSVAVLDPNVPAPTVTTIPDDFVHYSEPRVMTVRECARLQTFPDWFEFKGPYTTGGKQRVQETPRYTQVGNAVPSLFAEILGVASKEVLGDG